MNFQTMPSSHHEKNQFDKNRFTQNKQNKLTATIATGKLGRS